MSERRKYVDEITIKILMVSVALWLLATCITFAQAPDPIDIAHRAEALGIVGILAAVIVILVVALVIVYRGKEAAALRREERLEKLVESVVRTVDRCESAQEYHAARRAGQ